MARGCAAGTRSSSAVIKGGRRGYRTSVGPGSTQRQHRAAELAGLAHVSTLAFIAARAAPPLGFPLSLAGGVAIARSAHRLGLRNGYGVGLGAVLETAAVVGPARLGGPISQAISAPLIGGLARRGAPSWLQVLAVAVARFAYTALTTTFFILVIAGGLGAYTNTYEQISSRVPLLPDGTVAAMVATAVALLAWAGVAGALQVLGYRRAAKRWPVRVPAPEADRVEVADGRRRFDPRVVVLAACGGFAAILAFPQWPVLAAAALWLLTAAALSPPDRSLFNSAAVLSLLLGALALLIGVLGTDLMAGLRLATRAVLLVAIATWMRGATGELGFREVTRRALSRVRAIPPAPEARDVLDRLGTGRRLGGSVRSLLAHVRPAGRRPLPVLDAMLRWIADESAAFRGLPPAPALKLRLGASDALLGLGAAPAVIVGVLVL